MPAPGDLAPWPGRRLSSSWLIFSTVYGACVLLTAVVHDAGSIALTGFAVTVPMIGLLAAIDVTTRQLPRAISYATCALALPLLSFDPRLDGDGTWSAARGALLMVAITMAIRFVGRGSLGRGDVHFSPLLGAVAGWFGAREVVATWLATAMLGGFVAMIIVLSGRSRTTRFAYGPLMLLGLCAALLITAWR
jgi:leader peptidase (prepilin peptidase)/N-methyltransferase